MAGASLIFPYQWRAFWRRALRVGRVKFYLTWLALLGVMSGLTLPRLLARAAGELAAGRTASMDSLLLALCVLWVVAPGEELNVSLSNDRLRRFPLSGRALLALRLLSIFLSPIAWLASIISVVALSPFLRARHPVLGGLAALFFLAIIVGVRLSVSQLLGIADRRRRRLVVAALAIPVVAYAAATAVPSAAVPLRESVMAANPATIVTTIAVASTPSAIVAPLVTLLVSGAAVWYLLSGSFRRCLHSERPERATRRSTSLAWLPGRLGPLVLRELRSVRGLLDQWVVTAVVVAAAAVLSLATSLPSTVRQAMFVIVCALHTNMTTNCLGLDRPASLTRYLILPIRGTDLVLAKNIGLMVIIAAPLALLVTIGTWQSGVARLGVETVVVVVLLLAHLAWGNVVSVVEPHRIEPGWFTSAGDPVTFMVSMSIGSAPGVAVIVLLQSDSPNRVWATATIVLLTMAAYYGSLRFAGRSFERRVEIIRSRLA